MVKGVYASHKTANKQTAAGLPPGRRSGNDSPSTNARCPVGRRPRIWPSVTGKPNTRKPTAPLSESGCRRLLQWQLLQRTPVQYYIVSNLSPDSLKPLLEKQLAGIPRTPQSNTPFEPLSGSPLQHQPIGSDGQTDISAWSWQPFYH